MATLRDFVSEKKIKCPNQNGQWVEINFSNSGYSGSHGPELAEVYYNFDKHFDYNGEKQIHWQQTWEKVHNDPNLLPAFYPIISTAIDTDDGAYVTGALHLIGENSWWDTAMTVGRDDIVSGGLGNYKLTTHMQCDAGVFYKTEYDFEQYFEGEPSDNDYQRVGFDEIVSEGYAPQYNRHWYIPNGYANEVYYRSFCPPPFITGNVRVGDQRFYNIFDGFSSSIYTEQTPCGVEVDTNVPVIIWDYDWYTQNHSGEVNSAMHSYLTDGDLSRFGTYVTNGNCVICNGYVAPSVTEGTKQFNMYSDVYRGYWDVDEPINETFEEYRYLQVWVAPSLTQQTEPRVSLYKDRNGEELRARIKVYGDVKQYRYSEDGGDTWTTVTAETAGDVLTLPWDYLYYKRTDELRWLIYDKNHGGNMLLFDTEALCDDGSPWLASDYNEKNFYYPTTNETGTPEVSTLMGTTGLKSVFSKKYVVQYSDLVNIANSLFTSGGMVEDLKKGLEMFGNPIEAIQGLMYFPVDLATYFSLVTSSTVIIGGYEITGTNAKIMSRFNGYFDVGSIQILESFPGDDYRNFEPYCNLNIFLPFVGLESLKMNKYVGKTMSIRYYIDATTGECMACLFADGLLADYFTGQMGVHLPISLHDYSQFAGASMQALAGIAEGGANSVLSVPKGDVSGVIQGLAGFESSMFNLKQNSINNFITTKGTSSSLLNHYLPNYVYVIFEVVETDETSNLLTVEGRRTNASGTVGSFSGYLQVESVKLNCNNATDDEKSRIEQLLKTGIYI